MIYHAKANFAIFLCVTAALIGIVRTTGGRFSYHTGYRSDTIMGRLLLSMADLIEPCQAFVSRNDIRLLKTDRIFGRCLCCSPPAEMGRGVIEVSCLDIDSIFGGNPDMVELGEAFLGTVRAGAESLHNPVI